MRSSPLAKGEGMHGESFPQELLVQGARPDGMIRYVLWRPARADLRDVREWIRRDHPPPAITFVEELLARLSTLTERPMPGCSRSDLGPGVRVLVQGKFSIVYRRPERRPSSHE